jgi:hypothetical protein
VEAWLDRPEDGDAHDGETREHTDPNAHRPGSTTTSCDGLARRYGRCVESGRHGLRSVWDRSTVRSLAVVTAVLAFIVVLLIGVVDAGRRVGDLGHRRDEALARESEPVDVAGDVADAFRRFRPTLHPGDRFTLVFDQTVDRDRMGTYRLVALSYLYPAVATPDGSDADAVMVFGETPPSILARYEEIGVVDGVWLGRRRT